MARILKSMGLAAAIAATVSLSGGGATAAVMSSPGALSGAQAAIASDGLVQRVQRRGRFSRGLRGRFGRPGFQGRGIRPFRSTRRGYSGRRYGGWRGRRGGGRWIGPAIGAGIAGAILGGYPYYSRPYYYDRPYYYRTRRYYGPRRQYRSAWQRCAARYRSFRRSDGTFQPYGGVPRRLCPYLR